MHEFFRFTTKASRPEYWAITALGYLVFTCGFLTYDLAAEELTARYFLIALVLSLVSIGVMAVSVIAIFAVAARRCVDLGLSPYWSLLYFANVFAVVAMLALGLLPAGVSKSIKAIR